MKKADYMYSIALFRKLKKVERGSDYAAYNYLANEYMNTLIKLNSKQKIKFLKEYLAKNPPVFTAEELL